ncbi:hypothetical protein A9Q81_17645 [Gammaproteobacteria bacterium 42_54_T18]|nr:hypothetical protein A9Q81_17645 [Gammaproteobacteria bacterium 42_54_T18]
MNKIEFIYQYPIKGFPREKLDVVKLRANEGFSEDRKYALSNGPIKVNENGHLSPCQAFQRMTIRPDLSMFKLERKDGLLQLITPSEKPLQIELEGDSTELLSENYFS